MTKIETDAAKVADDERVKAREAFMHLISALDKDGNTRQALFGHASALLEITQTNIQHSDMPAVDATRINRAVLALMAIVGVAGGSPMYDSRALGVQLEDAMDMLLKHSTFGPCEHCGGAHKPNAKQVFSATDAEFERAGVSKAFVTDFVDNAMAQLNGVDPNTATSALLSTVVTVLIKAERSGLPPVVEGFCNGLREHMKRSRVLSGMVSAPGGVAQA